MDIKDLMVGDWVSVSGKSVKITKDDLATMLIFLDDYSKIDPIPITEEILVKNGWEGQTDGTNDFFVSRILPELWHYVGTDYYSYDINTQIKYVHQLQHLLRLCGIEKEIEL